MRRALTGFVIAGLLAGCEDSRPEHARSVVEINGAKVTLPAGWTGRARAIGTAPSLAHLEVANFPLRRRAAPKRLRAGQIFVVVSESDRAGDVGRRSIEVLAPDARVSIAPRDFLPRSSPRRPAGHQTALYSFTKRRRFFDVEVSVGGATPPRSEAARRVNAVLETVVIEPRP